MIPLLLALFVGQAVGIPDVFPNPMAEWTMGATDVVDLADARTRIYRYYIDGSSNGTQFQSVSCDGEFKPYMCRGRLSFTITGLHSVAITNSWRDDSATSEKSAWVTFNVVASGLAGPYNGMITIKQ